MKIHLDLDCFFASCERVRNPILCNKPIAVGGRSDIDIFKNNLKQRSLYIKNRGVFVPNLFYQKGINPEKSFETFFIENSGGTTKIRGIVTTASYEARDYGVRSGMTIRDSLKLCPKLQILPPNHLLYHEFSQKLYNFLKLKIPLIEQYSIDEFFGDLSGWIDKKEYLNFCKILQKDIYDKFGLPITIGIAESKWAAKLVTNSAKPFGVKKVTCKEWGSFIKNIPIQEFPGISKGYKNRLSRRGVERLGEVQNVKDLFYSWKKPGIKLYKRVLGIDSEPITPSLPRKSIGISRTFDPIKQRGEIRRRVSILARNLSYTVLKLRLNPTLYFLKIRYEDFSKTQKSLTINRIFSEKILKSITLKILDDIDVYDDKNIRFINISVSNFMKYKRKSSNILTYEKDIKFRKISDSIQLLRDKYGIDIIKSGCEI